jgi:hypothetical protein
MKGLEIDTSFFLTIHCIDHTVFAYISVHQCILGTPGPAGPLQGSSLSHKK